MDVDEFEDHLRNQVTDSREAGLDEDEVFLIAVKRIGELEALSRGFAREALVALYADTGKKGVNLVLDLVGSPCWSQCLKPLGVGGQLVRFGGTGDLKVESDIRVILWK